MTKDQYKDYIGTMFGVLVGVAAFRLVVDGRFNELQIKEEVLANWKKTVLKTLKFDENYNSILLETIEESERDFRKALFD